MEQMKVERLERERKALIISRKHPAIDILRDYKKSQLPWTELMPEPADFCDFPPIKAILELPSENLVDSSKFAEVVPLLPSLFTEWRAKIRRQICLKFDRHLLEKQRHIWIESISDTLASGSGQADHVDQLAEGHLEGDLQLSQRIALATTVFKCCDCGSGGIFGHSEPVSDDDADEDEGNISDLFELNLQRSSDISEPLFYPKVMGHRCLTRKKFWAPTGSDPSIDLDEFYGQRSKWSCKGLRVDNMAGMAMEDIIKACGLDPLIATAQEMDDLSVWLGCSLCADRLDPRTDDVKVRVFKWRAAVSFSSRSIFLIHFL